MQCPQCSKVFEEATTVFPAFDNDSPNICEPCVDKKSKIRRIIKRCNGLKKEMKEQQRKARNWEATAKMFKKKMEKMQKKRPKYIYVLED